MSASPESSMEAMETPSVGGKSTPGETAEESGWTEVGLGGKPKPRSKPSPSADVSSGSPVNVVGKGGVKAGSSGLRFKGSAVSQSDDIGGGSDKPSSSNKLKQTYKYVKSKVNSNRITPP